MATFAQIVSNQSLNVVIGTDVDSALAQHFVAGYDGGHPGTQWTEVPDGTQSGATSNGDGTFTNPPSVPSPPLSLTKLEFVTLCQTAGGMTDANLVSAHTDTNLAAMWIKLDMATSVDRDNAITTAGLAALAGLGYLPNGAAAVVSAWPTA